MPFFSQVGDSLLPDRRLGVDELKAVARGEHRHPAGFRVPVDLEALRERQRALILSKTPIIHLGGLITLVRA